MGLLNTRTSTVQILKLSIIISEEWRRVLRRALEIKFSSLSFHLLSQNRSSQGPVKTRMKTQKVPKHNGSQTFEVWIITLQKVTEKGGPCSTTKNKNTRESNTLQTKSKLSKGLIQLTELITD